MYLYDIQFKICHSRNATNFKTVKDVDKESDTYEFCGECKTIVHASLLYERMHIFWGDLCYKI